MKNAFPFLSLPFIFLIFILYSCNNDRNDSSSSTGQIQFSITDNAQNLALKPESGLSATTVLTAAVVTISDASGNIVQNSVIPLAKINGNYVSNPISLLAGNYQLTEFIIVDQSNNVILATPIKNSNLGYMVSNPLPIKISIQTNTLTNIIPDIISTLNNTPYEFGYPTFSFNFDSTFNFLVGASIYNSTVKNYQLTTASIAIYSDSMLLHSGKLNSVKPDISGITSSYDSLGVNNKITLTAKYNSYTINISKPNYISWQQTFTKSQLKQYNRNTVNGPLVVSLKNAPIPGDTIGLVAYYPFNEDVLDYSGHGNNGTAHGTLTPVTDHNGNPNAAYYFNGTDSYVEVPDAPLLNPASQITISLWYSPTSYIVNGPAPIIDKPCTGSTIDSSLFEYQIGVSGYNASNEFVFSICFSNSYNKKLSSTDTYLTGGWYHIVLIYDGNNIVTYINELIVSSMSVIGGSMYRYGQKLYIGYYGNGTINYFLPGSLSDIRIYNKALTKEELLSLN